MSELAGTDRPGDPADQFATRRGGGTNASESMRLVTLLDYLERHPHATLVSGEGALLKRYAMSQTELAARADDERCALAERVQRAVRELDPFRYGQTATGKMVRAVIAILTGHTHEREDGVHLVERGA